MYKPIAISICINECSSSSSSAFRRRLRVVGIESDRIRGQWYECCMCSNELQVQCMSITNSLKMFKWNSKLGGFTLSSWLTAGSQQSAAHAMQCINLTYARTVTAHRRWFCCFVLCFFSSSFLLLSFHLRTCSLIRSWGYSPYQLFMWYVCDNDWSFHLNGW